MDPLTTPSPSSPTDADLLALAGPARLAFGTPVRECPPLADRKAMAMVAANALILSVTIFMAASLQQMARQSALLAVVVDAAVLCLVVLVLAGGWHAYRCLVTSITPMPASPAYFRDLAALARGDYLATMRSLSHRQAIRAMLDYNYSVATQSAAKFAHVRRATRCLQIALPLWMGLLLLMSVSGGR